MKIITLYAPQIDAIIEKFNPENNLITPPTYLKLKEIYNEFCYVKPGNDDEIRHIWIEVNRGPVEAFGDYEEYSESGEVKSPEEFEQIERVPISGKYAGEEIQHISPFLFQKYLTNGMSVWQVQVL